ncbi:MAG: hypothetical protein Q8R55_00225 [Candidatus Taylorbacteria bacterium]|nr:hypothetical protein [Candidatus Taylorbacteria bacterium]
MIFKIINKISLLFIVVLFLLMSASNVSATVGGPTTIDRLSYSPNENSVYYIVHDGGGRGCPPIIEKLHISTKERTQVKSCDEIESTYHRDESSAASYNQFIEDTFKDPNIKSLPIISLTNNNISIIVEYVAEHRFDEYNVSSDFRATIFQDNQKKGAIDFIGCYKDQPNVFQGYIIPDTNKMAVEISRIGDCFEGGYTKDDVYILDDINFQDINPVGYYNYPSEPGVHRGNLVVFAQDGKTVTNIPSETETTEKNKFTSFWWIPALIAGLVVGFIAGHKTRTKSAQEFAAKDQN